MKTGEQFLKCRASTVSISGAVLVITSIHAICKLSPPQKRKKEKKKERRKMFWGCISHNIIGSLSPVKDTMNSNQYINVIEENIIHKRSWMDRDFSPRSHAVAHPML